MGNGRCTKCDERERPWLAAIQLDRSPGVDRLIADLGCLTGAGQADQDDAFQQF